MSFRNMLQAIEVDDVPTVKRLLGQNPQLAQLRDDRDGVYGYTALHHATENGRPEVSQALIDSGADVDVTSGLGYRPLQFAVRSGNVRLVSLLLDAGADVNGYNDKMGDSALVDAASMGIASIVELLLSRGAEVNRFGSPLCAATNQALGSNDTTVVQLLLDAGADLSTLAYGQTALHIAVDDLQLTKLLLDAGVNVNAVGDMERTPLHEAAQKRLRPIIEALLAAGADVNAMDNERRTPLALVLEDKEIALGGGGGIPDELMKYADLLPGKDDLVAIDEIVQLLKAAGGHA